MIQWMRFRPIQYSLGVGWGGGKWVKCPPLFYHRACRCTILYQVLVHCFCHVPSLFSHTCVDRTRKLYVGSNPAESPVEFYLGHLESAEYTAPHKYVDEV